MGLEIGACNTLVFATLVWIFQYYRTGLPQRGTGEMLFLRAEEVIGDPGGIRTPDLRRDRALC